MSILPDEFVELMAKKRELEAKIQHAVSEFEKHFGGVVLVGNIDLLKIKTIGGTDNSIVTISLEIA